MDPYKILNTTKEASDDDVKRAYRRMATKYHPDAGGDAWVFQQIQEAYELIVRERSPTSKKPPAKHKPTSPPNRTPPEKPQPQKDQPQRDPRKPTSTRPPKAASPHSQQTQATNAKPPEQTDDQRSMFADSFSAHLPLQTETMIFLIVNLLDIFATYALIRTGAYESNPIARYFFDRWNIQGMVYFKMFVVAFVCVLSQIIARQHLTRASQLLWIGIIIVGSVVVYSAMLLSRRL